MKFIIVWAVFKKKTHTDGLGSIGGKKPGTYKSLISNFERSFFKIWIMAQGTINDTKIMPATPSVSLSASKLLDTFLNLCTWHCLFVYVCNTHTWFELNRAKNMLRKYQFSLEPRISSCLVPKKHH